MCFVCVRAKSTKVNGTREGCKALQNSNIKFNEWKCYGKIEKIQLTELNKTQNFSESDAVFFFIFYSLVSIACILSGVRCFFLSCVCVLSFDRYTYRNRCMLMHSCSVAQCQISYVSVIYMVPESLYVYLGRFLLVARWTSRVRSEFSCVCVCVPSDQRMQLTVSPLSLFLHLESAL